MDIPADIRLRCYNQIKRVQKDYMEIEERTFEKECIWIYGPPRTGKSRAARTAGPYFLKLANKWWDGFRGQKHTVIDDLGRDKAKCLTDHIK